MASPFKRIGIFGRAGSAHVNQTLIELINFLIEKKHEFWIEKETASRIGHEQISVIDKEQLGEQCDLLIVVGGDGSLLHAAHVAVSQNIPVLGINRGSLGFLTDILPTKINKIHEVLCGEYVTEHRFMLTATVQQPNQNAEQDDALNEVVISPSHPPHMIEFEIYVDKQFVCSQHGDGLIIATPTGSTAYALSGGGPILHPQLDAIVLVPMFPHTLSHRPIVIDGKSEVEVRMSPKNKNPALISCDGHDCIQLNSDTKISIKKKSLSLKIIHPLDYQYFETLRSKLHWGKRLTETE